MEYHKIDHDLEEKIPVWRYMDMSKFSLLFCRKKLWFSRADLLGDEHEGSIPNCMIEKRESKWGSQQSRNIMKRGSEEGRKHVFVNCWTKHDPESYAMWKIYTPKATGVAIQSSVGRLAKCFVKTPNDFFERYDAKIEPIEYDLDLIKNPPDDDSFKRFQHKLSAYSYEQEIRATFWSCPTVEKPSIGVEHEVDLDVLIEKIFISHRLGDGLDQFVRDILYESQLEKEIKKPSFVATPKF